MEIATLAVKQKRLKDWSFFLEREIQDPQIKLHTEKVLKQYANLLFRCWEKGLINEEDAGAIGDLERELEQLNEEARLRVPGRRSARQ